VVQRGVDRTETVRSVRRNPRGEAIQDGGVSSLEASLDLFNLLNANHVRLQTEALGSTWGPADPHPDAAHHPLRRDRTVLTPQFS
jgi:hypothetical protein